MGDAEQGTKFIQLMEAWKDKPHSAPSCIKVAYSPGPNGWGGICWQNKPDNWGDKPGEDFSHAGYKRLTFWARGETGQELIEFKAGGINAPGKQYKDSFETSASKIQVEKEWTVHAESRREESFQRDWGILLGLRQRAQIRMAPLSTWMISTTSIKRLLQVSVFYGITLGYILSKCSFERLLLVDIGQNPRLPSEFTPRRCAP